MTDADSVSSFGVGGGLRSLIALVNPLLSVCMSVYEHFANKTAEDISTKLGR